MLSLKNTKRQEEAAKNFILNLVSDKYIKKSNQLSLPCLIIYIYKNCRL